MPPAGKLGIVEALADSPASINALAAHRPVPAAAAR
jgi:hypothetical protein